VVWVVAFIGPDEAKGKGSLVFMTQLMTFVHDWWDLALGRDHS
jgi:hypothetical protein